MNYRREIDGLRALAVLPVILFHAGFEGLSGGFVGVDVFFVISGFLISTIIFNALDEGRFSLLDFYERRARRILPALFVVLLCSVPLALLVMLPGGLKTFASGLLSVLTFTSNIFFWRHVSYFDNTADLNPLLHTWSLAVEEQYYIIFPLVMILLYRYARRMALPLILLGFVASLALSQWALAKVPEASYYLLPTRAWEILAGALAAWYCVYHRSPQAHPGWVSQLLATCGAIMVLGAMLSYSRSTEFPGINALLPVGGAVLLLVFATAQTWVGRLLGLRPVVGIGLVSYSAYLWHQPLFAFARLYNAELGPLSYVALILATFALAYLTWKYVETPWRNKRSVGSRRAVYTGVVCCSLVAAFSITTHLTKGFLFMVPPADRSIATIDPAQTGAYVEARVNTLRLKPFGQDGKQRVLIIGDSFAQDLVNAVYESGATKELDLSTRYIGSQCGNVFAPRELVDKWIPTEYLSKCPRSDTDMYHDAALKRLMAEADQIWLVSSWKPWQVELLPLSIDNIRKASGKTPTVFGPKYFGRYTVGSLLKLSPAQRVQLELPVGEVLKTNELLKTHLAGITFIDQLQLFCGEALPACKPFTASGELISPDGSHLSLAGANLYGERLRALNVFSAH